RAVAPNLHRALIEGRDVLVAGGLVAEAESAMAAVVTKEPSITLDYAICRDARTLGPARSDRSPRRLLIAAEIDGVRLIDNIDATPENGASGVEYPSAVLRASSSPS
ncbi:MAG TPA: pantoate--beta-alanine ligase, partial [Acidimicrobiales bacterium]|nr:pantoate--beta-alanine ligase [Acidimicrobiales bacterium]